MLVANTSKYNEMGSIMEHEHVSCSSFDEVLACKGASPMKPIASEKDLVVFLSGEVEKENSFNSSLQLDPVNTQRNSTKISKKTAREELKEISNAKNGDSAGKRKSYKERKICQEVRNEEKGNANDDTRACSKVSEKETKALDLKNGEAEAMLRELIRKQNLRRGQNNLVVQFQIRVLTLIFNDSENECPSLTASNGSNSWLKASKDLIAESDHIIKDFPLDWLEEGASRYHNLDLSRKLRKLTLLKFSL
ncbi:uncharacterized protein LOC114182508 [Vigna unguiculata]|uniref:uncharacterized protein LOC114182508 n=1 Tax=Vigna unguiculata TaxID=3917 RepID=UPI00101620F4|nr:uncharacterized protein LOC114182508 [Vigna unguiculata]